MRARIHPLLAAGVLTGLLAGCSGEPLLHGLDEHQANEVLVALDDGGIPATRTREDGAEGGFGVEVARGDAARARRLLSERALPRSAPPGFDGAQRPSVCRRKSFPRPRASSATCCPCRKSNEASSRPVNTSATASNTPISSQTRS